jgi:hypothetical protein
MTDAVYAPSTKPSPIPVHEILPWLGFAGLLAFVALYLVGVEQGAISLFAGEFVHEVVHDGRHALGYPCH